jgi:hypothetical protein
MPRQREFEIQPEERVRYRVTLKCGERIGGGLSIYISIQEFPVRMKIIDWRGVSAIRKYIFRAFLVVYGPGGGHGKVEFTAFCC